MNDYADRLNVVLTKAKARSMRVLEMLEAELGQSMMAEWRRLCPECKTCDQRLDVTETTVATGEGELSVVWEACPECSVRERLAEAGVPENLLPATLMNWTVGDPKDTKALAKAVEFARGTNAFLILESATFGNGKSHLAVGIMREFIARNRTVRFWTQARFLRSVRARYDDRKAEDVVESAKRTGLLVLDDLGVSVGGRDEQPTLHEVLDERYGQKRPTVFTTNIKPDEFEALLGPRMTNRLREATFAWVRIHGPSRRASNRAEYLRG